MSDSFANVPGGSQKLNSGYNIPFVGFGTYKVTGENVPPAIDAALTAGYRMFDTAKYYLNEKELGEALKVNFYIFISKINYVYILFVIKSSLFKIYRFSCLSMDYLVLMCS